MPKIICRRPLLFFHNLLDFFPQYLLHAKFTVLLIIFQSIKYSISFFLLLFVWIVHFKRFEKLLFWSYFCLILLLYVIFSLGPSYWNKFAFFLDFRKKLRFSSFNQFVFTYFFCWKLMILPEKSVLFSPEIYPMPEYTSA